MCINLAKFCMTLRGGKFRLNGVKRQMSLLEITTGKGKGDYILQDLINGKGLENFGAR